MSDQVTRSAARWATLVAVPVTLLTGLAAFGLLRGEDGAVEPTAAPATSAPPAGPTGPVTMSAPALDQRNATACRALFARLPDTIRGLPRRPVTTGAEQNAAYGAPPVTVACGVPPARYPATDDLWQLNGVCWHARREPSGTVWTTVDRRTPVQVTVPARYDPPGQWVITLAGPVGTTLATLPAPPDCTP